MTQRAQIINSIGLALALIGVAILFRFGPPQPSFEIGTGIAIEDDTPVDANGRTAKQRESYATAPHLIERSDVFLRLASFPL